MAATGAEIDRDRASFFLEIVKRAQMPCDEVHHMDVVAHASAIRRWIVVAKHAQLRPLSDGNLRDEGKKIVGNAAWVFPDPSGWVCTDRIEVSKRGKGE